MHMCHATEQANRKSMADKHHPQPLDLPAGPAYWMCPPDLPAEPAGWICCWMCLLDLPAGSALVICCWICLLCGPVLASQALPSSLFVLDLPLHHSPHAIPCHYLTCCSLQEMHSTNTHTVRKTNTHQASQSMLHHNLSLARCPPMLPKSYDINSVANNGLTTRFVCFF